MCGKPARIRSRRDAVDAGLALIPEDRARTGLATALPIVYNLTLANLNGVSRFGFLDHAAEKRIAADCTARLRIRAESPRQLAGRLSGGNPQEGAIAKWLVGSGSDVAFEVATDRIECEQHVG